MNTRRIAAVMYRHIRPTLRDPMRIMDMFYWPLLDIVLWGFTALWLGNLNPNNPNGTTMLLSALVMWQVVFRSSIEVTRNLLEEIWHQNLINLFASPITVGEWLVGILSISLINSIWNLAFGALMVGSIFGVNVLFLGFALIPYYITLLFFGWFCGLLAASAIMSFGRRVEMIAWSLPWFFSTFSCVFYPASVLPPWVQKIAWMLPSTYVFENVRTQIAEGRVDLSLAITGLFLTLLFFFGSLLLFRVRFRAALSRGLNTLT